MPGATGGSLPRVHHGSAVLEQSAKKKTGSADLRFEWRIW
jgi:hypothetical protein